jgi:NTE family protein
MPRPVTTRPDVLVLGAGGTLGIAWLRGMLTGMEEAAGIDFRRCDHFVGTSAGSVVAATLASGARAADAGGPAEQPDAAATADSADPSTVRGEGGRFWRAARAASAWAGAVAAPVAPAALKVSAPGGAVLRAAVLNVGPKPTRRLTDLERYVDSLGVRFDGRLRITGVDKARGRRVVFGAPGTPKATVAQAVAASCAVPWLFSPVEIDGREYVDGGAWSPTNLDAAPAGRGADVLCLMPTANPAAARTPLGALRAATHAAALAEMQALRARGARVRLVAPDAESGRRIGINLMDGRRSSAAYEAGLVQGRALGRS